MKKLTVLLGAVFLLLVGFEVVTYAEHRGSIRHSRSLRYRNLRQDIRIQDYDALRLQRERIEAAEEARRETGREKRREEVDDQLKQSRDEFLESQEAIRFESEAAANSPRGFYYRKPGSRTSSLPGGSVELTVDDKTYHYYRGIFYRQLPGAYIAVTAPPGAHLKELPDGSTPVQVDGMKLFYYFGSYFHQNGDSFTVTVPPGGSVVRYLPDGYVTERSEEGTRYTFGGVRYRPYYQEGAVVYAVQGI